MNKIDFTQKTKPWIITLVVITFLLIFLIIWLLIGEIDLLDVEYIVAKDGIMWKGKVTTTNVDWLVAHFAKYGVDESKIRSWLDHWVAITNITGNIIFNPLLLAWTLPILVLSIIIPILLRIFKLMNIDVLPFSFSISIACFAFIITALMPLWGTNGFGTQLVRLGIMAICGVVSFIISNKIVCKYYAYNNLGSQLVNEMKINKKQDDIANKKSNQLFSDYKKMKDDKDITYIDVPKKGFN